MSDLLKGIKIIDFSRLLPGPVATHMLAQMGAEVIKIESPKRMDYARMTGPQVDGASILFHQLNHNKTLRLIEYATPGGKDEVMDLIKGADALIEQFRPGAMQAWGFGYEDVKAVNPEIVYISLTGYGQDNDYAQEAGHDFNYLAYSGVMSFLKDAKGKPIIPETQFADVSSAYMTIMALQAGLIHRYNTAKGKYIDVPISDSVNPFLTIPYALHSSGIDYRKINLLNGKTTVNYNVYACQDGKWLSVAAMEIKFWNNICDVIGKPDWKRKNEMELLIAVFPKSEVDDLFKSKTRDEWMSLFKGKDVCVAPILELEELEPSPFHQQKGTFETFETEGGQQLTTVALPFKAH